MKKKRHFTVMGELLPMLTTTLLILAMVLPVQAQRSRGDVGIGAQFGKPTGFSMQVYNPTGMSFDLLVAWDLDDFFFVNPHGVFQSHIGDSQAAHVFYGPGAYLGFHDYNNNGETGENEVEAGISGTIGLGFLIKKFEIYGRLTPRLRLTQSTAGGIGGGIGVRYYF